MGVFHCTRCRDSRQFSPSVKRAPPCPACGNLMMTEAEYDRQLDDDFNSGKTTFMGPDNPELDDVGAGSNVGPGAKVDPNASIEEDEDPDDPGEEDTGDE